MFYGAQSGCNVLTLTQLQPSLFDSFFSEGVGWLPGTHLTQAFFLTGPYLACYLLRPSWIWNFYRSPCKREPIAILYLALLSFRLHCLSLWRRLKSRQLKSPLFSSTKERLAALEHGGLILSHKKQVTQLWIEDLGTLSNNQGELYKPIQNLLCCALCYLPLFYVWLMEMGFVIQVFPKVSRCKGSAAASYESSDLLEVWMFTVSWNLRHAWLCCMVLNLIQTTQEVTKSFTIWEWVLFTLFELFNSAKTLLFSRREGRENQYSPSLSFIQVLQSLILRVRVSCVFDRGQLSANGSDVMRLVRLDGPHFKNRPKGHCISIASIQTWHSFPWHCPSMGKGFQFFKGQSINL